MIVGNGLLANTFREDFESSRSIIIFASGVSNSQETKQESFQREIDLLKSQDKSKKLVYFSTVSILDKSLKNTLYVKHKIFIEDFIKENFKKYVIFRLPIVVSNSLNKNTFFNAMRAKIESNDDIFVNKFSTRYLIDVDDLKLYLPKIIKSESSIVMNVCFDNKKTVLEIVRSMIKILGKVRLTKVIKEGSDYNVDNKDFLSRVPKALSENYNENLLEKYLK